MSQPVTIYLIGRPGCGKYTCAKELAKYDFKVVDNHLINNPIFSLMNLDGKTPIPKDVWQLIDAIRAAVLTFISQDRQSNYVLTNVLYETEEDHELYEQVRSAAETRGSLFVPIILHIGLEEHYKRISTPERRLRFKHTEISEECLNSSLIKFSHPNLKQIDVTSLASGEVAKQLYALAQHLVTRSSLI
ncbi:hypothetical protein [Candidatus Odyssella thessalonicensis]|uniref:hypothetical protein n=1 Tax=Candidatus Odyssella thessalonicensis TaxID=84647 RepID=UPI000225A9CD|nr:hypothetical protein [Candidatus Odyssella thessalonicensis]